MMEEKRMAQLDPRLERVADFVRPGALFADVGCDHGHLSVELMRRGAQRGFACDIKEIAVAGGKAKSGKGRLCRPGADGTDRPTCRYGAERGDRCGHCRHRGRSYQRDFGARSFFTAGRESV